MEWEYYSVYTTETYFQIF